ncbi:hypothetical protein [Pseudoalteromonas aurantia]|nr:hypothetical protein [Pseudoalteromonas aurantia]
MKYKSSLSNSALAGVIYEQNLQSNRVSTYKPLSNSSQYKARTCGTVTV